MEKSIIKALNLHVSSAWNSKDTEYHKKVNNFKA